MEFVNFSTQGNIGVLTICREKALNALNTAVLKELNEVIDTIDTKVIRCLIIKGSGNKAFVAGADIAEMKDMDSKAGLDFGNYGNDVFLKIENLPIPVIAMINGYALGGGSELALSCDIRLCSTKSVFGQPEVGLGITPGFGGTQRLAKVIGIANAKEIIYTARLVKADEAEKLGYVNHVYEEKELENATMKLATKIARNAPIAVANCKKAMRNAAVTSNEEGVKLEAKLFANCFDSEDQVEGMSAFLEGRKEKNFLNK